MRGEFYPWEGIRKERHRDKKKVCVETPEHTKRSKPNPNIRIQTMPPLEHPKQERVACGTNRGQENDPFKWVDSVFHIHQSSCKHGDSTSSCGHKVPPAPKSESKKAACKQH